MKQILIILSLCLSITSCVIKKTNPNAVHNDLKNEMVYNPDYIPLSYFNGDTSKYLKTNFLKQKSFYENKELDILLHDLELPIKEFTTGVNARNMDISPSLSLNFYIRDLKEAKIREKKDPLVMYVVWQVGLPEKDVSSIIRATYGDWNQQAFNYFKQFKIKEIGMLTSNQ